jgi:hypothetical protein
MMGGPIRGTIPPWAKDMEYWKSVVISVVALIIIGVVGFWAIILFFPGK